MCLSAFDKKEFPVKKQTVLKTVSGEMVRKQTSSLRLSILAKS